MCKSNSTNRTLFIFGNGIGIALEDGNNVKEGTFSLKKAFKNCWGNIEDDTKKLIENLIRHHDNPDNEDDLRHLQRFCWSSDDDNVNLITEYLAKVTYQFFQINSNHFKETELCKSLCSHIKERDKGAISVATLNYDKLLYGSLFNEGIFEKYLLIDGFLKDGFNPEECVRKNPKSGWFLHLHGNPLYRSNDGQVVKRPINDVETEATEDNKNLDDNGINEFQNTFKRHHVVLTAPFYKQKIIEDSIVLKSYWEIFSSLLSGRINNITKACSVDVVFIGYSGNDPHLNSLIRENKDAINSITIIEYSFPKKKLSFKKSWYDKELRKFFWNSKFHKNVTLLPFDNINSVDLEKVLTNE